MGVRADIVATARATIGHIIRYITGGGSAEEMPNRQYLDFAGNCTVQDDGEGIKVTVPEVPAGSVTVGNVTLTAPGTMPSITNTGTPIHAVLNFTLPQGIQGPQGVKGDQGIQGPQGIQGETGPAPTLVTGTTTTGAAGSSASLTIVSQGNDTYAVNATIPQGAKGDTGNTGATGADGFSPVATVTQLSDGVQITITDASGTTTGTVLNGGYTATSPLDITSGVISVADATINSKGVVSVGTNISVSNGAISVADATTQVKGVVSVGSNISVSNGEISVSDASTSAKGVVQLESSVSGTSGLVPDSAAVQAFGGSYLAKAGGTMTGSIGMTVTAVSAADIDLSTTDVFTKTLSANTTFTFSNLPSAGVSKRISLVLYNGASYNVQWPASVTWAGGNPPTLTAGPDVIDFLIVGTSAIGS